MREFRPDDLDQLAAMVADEEQMRFYRRPRTRAEACEWLDRNRALYDEHGFGFWLVESRPSSEFLGYCGIRPLVLDGVTETEIGWHIKKTVWNRGIATEAAAGVHELARARFAQMRLIALVPPDHLASRRVAEKLGMRERRQIVLDGVPYAAYVSEPE